MKRTRRVEVIRYSRRVEVSQGGYTTIPINELLAIHVSPESTLEEKDVTTLSKLLPVPEPQSKRASRLRRILRVFKTEKVL